MKKNCVIAVLICIAALNVNAQTEEPESKAQKFFRLTKAADENPNDWKAQLEAGHFLLDKENGMYNQSQAEKYYERIYHMVTDYHKDMPDSIFWETGMALTTVASSKQDINKALFYADEMLHAGNVGIDMPDNFFYSFATVGWSYNMMKGDFVKALPYMMGIRERLTNKNHQGIEHTDVTTILLFENLIGKYKEMFGDKLVELTFDGKKYIIVGKADWNIEKPFMGWLQEVEGSPTLLCDEDGKIHDDIHGEMVYGFKFFKDHVVPEDGTNMRLITVTPERRQQLVEAYQKYIKKAKKNQK